MDVVERSRDRVEELLSALESEYESFAVRQTTATVPSAYYERVHERYRDDVGRVDVHVTNDDGDVLVVGTEDEPRLPSAYVSDAGAITSAGRCAVETTTDVACAVDGLDAVTIVGVHDDAAPDGDPIYCLVALLRGEHVAGEPSGECRWATEPPTTDLVR